MHSLKYVKKPKKIKLYRKNGIFKYEFVANLPVSL